MGHVPTWASCFVGPRTASGSSVGRRRRRHHVGGSRHRPPLLRSTSCARWRQCVRRQRFGCAALRDLAGASVACVRAVASETALRPLLSAMAELPADSAVQEAGCACLDALLASLASRVEADLAEKADLARREARHAGPTEEQREQKALAQAQAHRVATAVLNGGGDFYWVPADSRSGLDKALDLMQ